MTFGNYEKDSNMSLEYFMATEEIFIIATKHSLLDTTRG